MWLESHRQLPILPLLKGALGTPQAVANTVSKSIPLAFTGLAVALGSRCGMLNIGAEGQLHAGAMAATLTGLTLSFLPAPILLVVSIAAGIAAGMLVGSVPGIFKAKFQTNEVIVAIMLNYICTLFTSWLVNGPFKVRVLLHRQKCFRRTSGLQDCFQRPN